MSLRLAPLAVIALLAALAAGLITLAPPNVDAQGGPPADVDENSLALSMSGTAITAEWDHVADAASYHITLKAQGGPGSPVDVDTAYPAFDGNGNPIKRQPH